jgi:hypothetical protein
MGERRRFPKPPTGGTAASGVHGGRGSCRSEVGDVLTGRLTLTKGRSRAAVPRVNDRASMRPAFKRSAGDGK